MTMAARVRGLSAAPHHRRDWVLVLMLGVLALMYLCSYAVIRWQQVLIRVEFMGNTSDTWQHHRIETAGAVEDPARRRWALWITFWPLSEYFSLMRICPCCPLSIGSNSSMYPSSFNTAAMPVQILLFSMSTRRRPTRFAFRIRVNMSAMGS